MYAEEVREEKEFNFRTTREIFLKRSRGLSLVKFEMQLYTSCELDAGSSCGSF